MAYSGPDITNIPGYRVGLLFLLFLAILVVWSLALAGCKRLLRHRPGLLHITAVVQEEVLALGVISLALSALEKPLSSICIACSDCGEVEECIVASKKACLHNDGGYDTSHEPGTSTDTAHGDLVGHCPHGQQPFWPEEVLDQAHYLLFLLASVHILYAAFSMGLALLHLAWWRRWERQAVGKVDRGRHTVPRVGSTTFSHYGRALVMQFTLAMNSCVYLGLREKFMARLRLPAGFDFHRHVVSSMEWQFAKAIRVDWLMWIIAVVWLSLPGSAYAVFWLVATFTLASLVMGTHLVAVMIRLAATAHLDQGPIHRSGILWDVYHDQSIAQCSQQQPRAQPGSEDSEVQKSRQLAEVSGGRAGAPSQLAQVNADVVPAADQLSDSLSAGQGPQQPCATPPIQHVAGTDIPGQQPPEQRVALPFPAAESCDGMAPANVSKHLLGYADSANTASPALHAEQAAVQEPLPVWKLDAEPGFTDPPHLGKPAGSAAEHPRSRKHPLSVLKPAVSWLVQSPGDLLASKEDCHFCQGELLPEFKELFWFGKPQLVLLMLQYCYWQTGLTIAWILLGIWQGLNWDLTSWSGAQVYILMLVVNAALALHSSLLIMPMYGLAQAVGVASLPPERIAELTCPVADEDSLPEKPVDSAHDVNQPPARELAEV